MYAWQHGADVLSNSWGYKWPTSGWDVINVALDSAIQFGRDGLGCPVIFASGNNGGKWPGAVAYPASHPATFAVGATMLDDYRWHYSQWGPELDIVAPSGNICFRGDVWSLDQMGFAGFNSQVTWACSQSVSWSCNRPGHYDCHVGGTSAACPIVSGTAALLLARDSTLSAQQVYDILRGSAVTELDWGSLTDTPHVQYGYGRVDAFRAVLSISRGDINNDGADLIDISDLVYLVDWISVGGPAPFPSPMLADVNCSGGLPGDVADVVYLVEYMFTGGPPPVRPCFEF